MKIVKIDVNEQNKLACLSIVWYILFVETNKKNWGYMISSNIFGKISTFILI